MRLLGSLHPFYLMIAGVVPLAFSGAKTKVTILAFPTKHLLLMKWKFRETCSCSPNLESCLRGQLSIPKNTVQRVSVVTLGQGIGLLAEPPVKILLKKENNAVNTSQNL